MNKLRPSGAHIWLNCPGSAHARTENKETVYSKEGTKAHDYLEKKLNHFYFNDPREETEDLEIKNAVNFCFGYIVSVFQKQHVLCIEKKIKGSLYGNSMEGTVDFAAIKDNKLHVVDYKHGVGYLVKTKKNPQLLIYATLLFQENPGVKAIILHIVQPRSYSNDLISTWECSREWLKEWGWVLS